MKKYTLRNSFHNTACTVLAPAGMEYEHHGSNCSEVWAWVQANRPAVARRVRRSLCGVSGCTCGVVR